jgi:hypothetical protein
MYSTWQLSSPCVAHALAYSAHFILPQPKLDVVIFRKVIKCLNYPTNVYLDVLLYLVEFVLVFATTINPTLFESMTTSLGQLELRLAHMYLEVGSRDKL